MNQSKFSLADVLAALSALCFGFICFMGANFLNINNDKVWGMPHTFGCIVMAIVIALLLFGTAFGAKLLKRTKGNFKICFIFEVVLLVLFVIFAVFFTSKNSPFPHFFTVTNQKSEINSKLQTSITQAENMFAEYESYAENRETLYRNKLESVVAAKRINSKQYTKFGFEKNINDDLQIDTKMFMMHSDLFPSNYSNSLTHTGIKDVAIDWLQKAKKITNSWKPIGIVSVVNDIEKNSTEWLNTLNTLSKSRQTNEESPDFDYTLSFSDVKTHLKKINNPTQLSTGLAVLAYVLMLLSWVITKRDGRVTDAFSTKEYEVIL